MPFTVASKYIKPKNKAKNPTNVNFKALEKKSNKNCASPLKFIKL